MRDDSRDKNEASDLITMKDLLRFHAATGKAMVMENMTCNSLNMFAECFLAGFAYVTDVKTKEADAKSTM
jgi:hypothetical protein